MMLDSIRRLMTDFIPECVNLVTCFNNYVTLTATVITTFIMY